jgi:hypothetical protein
MGSQKEDVAKMSREEQLEAIQLRIEDLRQQWAWVKEALARLGDVELAVPKELLEALDRLANTSPKSAFGVRA